MQQDTATNSTQVRTITLPNFDMVITYTKWKINLVFATKRTQYYSVIIIQCMIIQKKKIR